MVLHRLKSLEKELTRMFRYKDGQYSTSAKKQIKCQFRSKQVYLWNHLSFKELRLSLVIPTGRGIAWLAKSSQRQANIVTVLKTKNVQDLLNCANPQLSYGTIKFSFDTLS